jgi:hypothetical protein
MNKKLDSIIYAATTLAFAAVAYTDWRLGSSLRCSPLTTPDANIGFDMGIYTGFRECLSSNGKAGIGRFVALHTFGFDLVFPLLLALTASLGLFRIANQLPRFARLPLVARWLIVTLLPVCYLVADYAENFAVMNWLKSGDSAIPVLIPAMTAAKFASLGVVLVLAIALKLATLRHKRVTPFL